MVTRTVVCVPASEAAKLAPKASWSSSSSSAEEDSISIIKKATTSTNNFGNNEERSDCDNNELERHVVLQVGFRTIRVQQRGAVRPTPAQPTTTNSNNNSNNNKSDGGKKRALPSEDIISGREVKKRQRVDRFVIDLSGVPPQQPIPKRKGYIIKEGKSKYAGVTFNKGNNKWVAQIVIDGMIRYIGSYESEETAAIDFARAVFKYKGQEALDKMRKRKSSRSKINLSDMPLQPLIARPDRFLLDLSDIPPQLPIPKSKGQIKEGTSKYIGVYFDKAMNKWGAQIRIKGKQRQQRIGWYENEKEAAIDYARAVLKYRGQDGLDKMRERKKSAPSIDLSDIPPQLPIPKSKSERPIKEGASKYAGVTFNKGNQNWRVRIMIEGKLRNIGSYKNEEEAAVDYARALFKYKGQEALDKERERNKLAPAIDLSDVPPQPPIPKTRKVKEGASRYTGVSFHKTMNKWMAQIVIEGKTRNIGYYENEEEAAADHARAVFKYKNHGLPTSST